MADEVKYFREKRVACTTVLSLKLYTFNHFKSFLLLQASKKEKKGSVLDLNKFIDKTIRVKFTGGREVTGILKGFDQLVNIVLDETIEYIRGLTLISLAI